MKIDLPKPELLSVLFWIASSGAYAQAVELRRDMVHLRNAEEREWSSFPNRVVSELTVNFSSEAGASDQTLELTQYDVKLLWSVLVNDAEIGKLVQDEKKTTTYFTIPASVLKNEGNILTIRSNEKIADDILVGAIKLHRGVVDNLMTASLQFQVTGADSLAIPAKITLVNENRSLQTFLISDQRNVAARAGCLYTAGEVSIRVPAGKYVAYATRGFEYGVDSTLLVVAPGDQLKHHFVLVREVDTKGWISVDTHVHTFTHSGHGDATMRERVLTLAGEGIELPVVTDHNIYVDLKPILDSVMMKNPDVQMTPVIGDEVTTSVGHFNVLNVSPQSPVIEHRGKTWRDISKAVSTAGPDKVVILNHARDVHNAFRPFDPSRHVSITGSDRDGWIMPGNAMEVINSGSQQTNYLLLFEDWFGMLNAGKKLTPIGSSDSHDVNRFIVGQGRTYAKARDDRPDSINILEAMRAIRNGEVMVSCGLLASIIVNGSYGPGTLAKGKGKVDVRIDVSGPSWSKAEVVTLYMNGVKIRDEKVVMKQGSPIRQAFSWDIDLPSNDVFFAAIVQGQAGDVPFWPIARPYQPSGPDWTPRFYAGTGAVWVDSNGNGGQESAFDYATRLLSQYSSDMDGLFKRLDFFDEAVASQVASMLWKKGQDLSSDKIQSALSRSGDHVRRGFNTAKEQIARIRK
ncbi:CehA/McbA family metallohydrolase [Chryseolinea sp. T2]|uniref:CehA/McbA family metallohydrolase n=1 Tax=Chryseolinea sp. T2 TaxID=3129255 RepID=UPI0030783593